MYGMFVVNPNVINELRSNPQGERAGIVMLLTFPNGKRLPVNYLQEDNKVYVGADGPWWREFRGAGREVNVEIRDEKLAGHAVTVLDDLDFTQAIVQRLRPNVPKWLPAWRVESIQQGCNTDCEIERQKYFFGKCIQNNKLLARPARFERATPGFGGQYSIHLSYGRLREAGHSKLTSLETIKPQAHTPYARCLNSRPGSVAQRRSPSPAQSEWTAWRVNVAVFRDRSSSFSGTQSHQLRLSQCT